MDILILVQQSLLPVSTLPPQSLLWKVSMFRCNYCSNNFHFNCTSAWHYFIDNCRFHQLNTL